MAGNDLWVLDNEKLRVFMGNFTVEVTPRDTIISGNNLVSMAIQYPIQESYAQYKEGVILFDINSSSFDERIEDSSMEFTRSSTFEFGGYGIAWADIIAMSLSIILMAAIILRPEWYVVNTTGILVGAGVSTMLGVSFVFISDYIHDCNGYLRSLGSKWK